ncbi:MAG: EI24 domain-containing protein [Mariprofundaceae bacterium]
MIQGILQLFSGMGLLLSKPELRVILWRIMALLAVLLVVLLVGMLMMADALIVMWVPEGDAWYWQVLAWLAWVLAVLLSAVTAVLSFSVLGSAAVAPWLDMLAARTESLYGEVAQASENSFSTQVMKSVVNSFRPFLGLCAWGVIALVFLLIPGLGVLLATLIWGYGGLRFLSYELIDVTASRRGWGFAQRKEQMKHRRFFWLGFSGTAMMLMFVPIVNLLVLPAAVVALSKPDGLMR